MREKTIEEYLIKLVKKAGGKIVKLTCPGEAGNPDRLIKIPGFPAALCELKRPGKDLEPLQQLRQAEWQAAGMLSGKAATHGEVDSFLAALRLQPRSF